MVKPRRNTKTICFLIFYENKLNNLEKSNTKDQRNDIGPYTLCIQISPISRWLNKTIIKRNKFSFI